MPIDSARHTQTAPASVLGCLPVSVGVCWPLLASVGMLCSLEMPWACLGDVRWASGGYLSGMIHGNQRRSDVFGGYVGSQSLQYGAKTVFWHRLEIHGFLSPDQTEALKYQNGRI